jgi:hypothetical protein
MTAQIDDVFRYRGGDYSIAGISEGEFFDVTALGIEPVGSCTACWRGYQAIFAVTDSHLVLDTLEASLTADGGDLFPAKGPVINGVSPSPEGPHIDFFNCRYEGLNHRIRYTGGLLLGHGFIESLYVHMGFHPAWKYESVMELIFEDGALRKEFDRSASMAEFRRKLLTSAESERPGRQHSPEEIVRFIENAFDRSYRM